MVGETGGEKVLAREVERELGPGGALKKNRGQIPEGTKVEYVNSLFSSMTWTPWESCLSSSGATSFMPARVPLVVLVPLTADISRTGSGGLWH
jgi:hypothetical protein